MDNETAALVARPLDEVYDTQKDVERNPCGAWQAIQSQADTITAQAALIAELQSGQTYRYIGRDGKTVLARDLEDRADKAEAAIAAARARVDEAAWLLGANIKDTNYDEWTTRKAAFLSLKGETP